MYVCGLLNGQLYVMDNWRLLESELYEKNQFFFWESKWVQLNCILDVFEYVEL